MIPILPRNYICDSEGKVYVGLVPQYHYVGYDQISMDVETSDCNTAASLAPSTFTGDNSPEDSHASTAENSLDTISVDTITFLFILVCILWKPYISFSILTIKYYHT